VDVDEKRAAPGGDVESGVVQLADPAVRARCTGPGLALGATVRVRLAEADLVRRKVSFVIA
jgi:hypothetical protein